MEVAAPTMSTQRSVQPSAGDSYNAFSDEYYASDAGHISREETANVNSAPPTSQNNNNNNSSGSDPSSQSLENVYAALERLRFEVLDANSQAIYLTQCREYVSAESTLVDTYNKLVGIEHEQQVQLNELQKEADVFARDEEVGTRKRHALEERAQAFSERRRQQQREGDPDVEGGYAKSRGEEDEEEEENMLKRDFAEQNAAEEDLSDRRNVLMTLDEQHKYAAQLNDLLKATTLNNIAFVIYHRGMFSEALSHLELARELEARHGSQSPSVAINLCVLQNAVGDFDLASQYALLAIDLLKKGSSCSADEFATTPSSYSAGADTWGGQDPQRATGLAPQTFDEKKKMWGAAWHNLAIAQLQLADPKSEQENSNVRLMFENSIAATIELLGRDHPMTRGVVESYRIVRKALRERGAFKPRRHLATGSEAGVPVLHTYFSDEALTTDDQSGVGGAKGYSAYTGRRIPPPTQRGSALREAQQISVVLRSKENIRYVEKIDTEPYGPPPPPSSTIPLAGGSGAGVLIPTFGGGANTLRGHGGALVPHYTNNTDGATASVVLVPVSPREAQRRRDAAVAKEQSLSSRRLTRGKPTPAGRGTAAAAAPYGHLPLPPIGTPRGNAAGTASSARTLMASSSGGGGVGGTNILNRSFGPSSVNNKNQFFVSSGVGSSSAANSGTTAGGGGGTPYASMTSMTSQNAKKNHIAKQTHLLGGSSMQGNLALAVALYSNPHPLSSSTTTPRSMRKQQQLHRQTQLGQYKQFAEQQQQQLQQPKQNSPRLLPAIAPGTVAPTASPSSSQVHVHSAPATSFVPKPPSPATMTNAAAAASQQQQRGAPQHTHHTYGRIGNSSFTNGNGSSASMIEGMMGGGMLIGDMWVEAPIAPPRAPFRTSAATANSGGGEAGVPPLLVPSPPPQQQQNHNGIRPQHHKPSINLSPQHSPSRSSSTSTSPVRAYPQQATSVPIEERVVSPSSNAHPDSDAHSSSLRNGSSGDNREECRPKTSDLRSEASAVVSNVIATVTSSADNTPKRPGEAPFRDDDAAARHDAQFLSENERRVEEKTELDNYGGKEEEL